MDKSIYWAWAIKNSICVICWTILAIVFDKWGIALIGGLFLSSFTTQPIHRYYRICDHCGKHSEYADTPENATKKAQEAGWIIRKVGDKWDDRCPDCQRINLRKEK
jgi:hypothetical protein